MLFIIYQTSRTRQTSQTPDTCPLKPETCPLTPNIRAKVTKNIFISYFFNLFYISSLVIRNSSFPYILSIFFALAFFLFCCLSNCYIFSYLYFHYLMFLVYL